LVLEFSHGVWMRFPDDVSELLASSIFRSSENIVVIINDWIFGLYMNLYGEDI
jgi:hypothetical protein